GDVSLLAGVDVEMDASASAGGTRQVLTPILSTETIDTLVITGYNQVVDAVIDVPVVNWVTTTVKEQVGLESVKIGYSFTTMDVKLTQDAYYNGSIKREYFVEGVDYRNSSASKGSGPIINWGSVAAPGNDTKGYPKSFAELSDLQVEVVLKQLGYKKLYNFSTNTNEMWKHQVLNGTSSRLKWVPDWVQPVAAGTSRLMHTVNLQVDGLRDKWITLPVGAEADLARAVSQGSVTKLKDEKVGSYKDTATVYYDQVTSKYTQQTIKASEPLADPNESRYPTRNTRDNDNSIAYWQVSYDAGSRGNGETASPDNGERVFTLYDDLGTAEVARVPEWSLNSDAKKKYDSKSGVQTIAQNLYYNTTASLSRLSLDANAGNSRDNHVAVGTTYNWVQKQYNLSGSTRNHFSSTGNYTLANVTNSTQRNAVDRLASSGSAWLGMAVSDSGTLYYDVKYTSVSSNSVSWSGRTTSYNNWNSGEPNDSGGFEFGVQFYFGNNKFNDLNGSQSLKWVYETGNTWNSSTVYEDYKDYHYAWVSTNTDIMQARYQLEYQWVSNETPEFDNRPKFRTFNTQTKVVDTAKQTLYRDEAITQTVTETRTVRLEGGAGGTSEQSFATFESNSVKGRDIEIVSGRDARLSGNLEADRNLTINTDRDFRLGETPAGVDPATYVPTSSSQMQIGGTLTLTAARGIETDMASLITVAGSATVGAAKDIDLKGDMVATGNITVTTRDDIDAFGVLDGSTVSLTSGTDGRGSVLTTLRTNIDAANLTIVAGTVDGDITFRDSAVDVTGTMTLTAAGGGLYATGGTVGSTGATPGNYVTANAAIMAARDGVQSDQGGTHAFLLSAGTLSVDVTAAGPIWIENKGDLDLTHAATFDGDVTLRVMGNLTVRDIVAGANAQNAISLATPAPVGGSRDDADKALREIVVGSLIAQSVDMSAATVIRQLAASSIVADSLSLVSNEGIDLGGLAVGTIDARIEGVGDMSLATLAQSATVAGDLNVTRLLTQDGLVSLTSERNIVLHGYEVDTSGSTPKVTSGVVAGRSADRTPQSSVDNPVVELAELPLDISLTSTGGSISGTGAIPHVKVATDAGGAIELVAATGLIDLTVEAAELRNLRTDTGGISLTETGSQNRTQTLLTKAHVNAGDITITTAEALEVLSVSGQQNTTSVTLTSTGGELFAKGVANTLLTAVDSAGDVVTGGLLGNVTLDAADALVIDSGLWVDAKHAVTFITGSDFVIPTQRVYDATELVINSATSINAESQIRVGRDGETTRVEIQSGRNITLNAPISTQQGTFVTQVVLNARGDVADTIQVYSDVAEMRVVTGASGAQYLEGIVGTPESGESAIPD
ncbi:hypothetical protein, partial [Celeribacter marinus]|uniref:hypothetical protein n=1 Tax=Celeribacter marinus TaxID=1397108 RepID=UPI003F6BC919